MTRITLCGYLEKAPRLMELLQKWHAKGQSQIRGLSGVLPGLYRIDSPLFPGRCLTFRC